MKKTYLFLGAVLVIVVVLAIVFSGDEYASNDSQDKDSNQNYGGEQTSSFWLNAEMVDVITGNTIKISDYDKPVLLESFAVWCPTCKKQQDEIKALHEEIGDAVVSIGLDTDPNESPEIVKEHAEKHGYDWIFAVSNPKLTKSLIDEFGTRVVNAPSAPVVLICPGGSSELLGRGVKDVEELKTAIDGC